MDRTQIAKLVDPRADQFETISLTDLQGLLAYEKSVRWATLITRTVPEMRKTANPHYGNLFKVSRTNFLIKPKTFSYTTSVNNQRVREGLLPDFRAMPRSWGTRMEGIPFVAHITKSGESRFYLEVYARKNFREIYQDSLGNLVDKEAVRPYIVQSRVPMTQGTKKPIILRDYSVANIIAVCIDRKRYLVRN